MLTRIFRTFLATLLLGSLALPVAAQPSAPSRLHNEYNRIHEGYKNGTLDRTQYKTDLVRFRHIRHQMRHDWQRDGGPMHNGQRKAIYRDEQRLSQRIHTQRRGNPPQ